MKKKQKLKILLGVFFGLLITLSLSVAVFSFTKVRDTSSVIDELKQKSLHSLLEEANQLGNDSVESGEASLYAAALSDKVKQIGEKKMMKMILNRKNAPVFRVMLLQLADEAHWDLDYREMEPLLFDSEENPDVIDNILINMGVQGGYDDLLEKVFETDKGMHAFQALKMLFISNRERAMALARETMQNYKKVSEEKLRISVLETGPWLRELGTAEEKSSFLHFCEILLEDPAFPAGSDVTECVYYALSDLQTEDAIACIFASDKISDENKLCAVIEHTSLLLSMLQNNITKEKLETVLNALKYYPVADFIQPLQVLETQLSSLEPKLTAEEETALRKEIKRTVSNLQKNGEYVLKNTEEDIKTGDG